MNDLMSRALDLAGLKGAQYADVRVSQTTHQRLAVKNGAVEALEFNESLGFGVRALVGGAWGFAASRTLTAAEVDRVTDLAVAIARASALARGAPVDLGPAVTSQGTYLTPIRLNPFSISTEAKIDLLLAA